MSLSKAQTGYKHVFFPGNNRIFRTNAPFRGGGGGGGAFNRSIHAKLKEKTLPTKTRKFKNFKNNNNLLNQTHIFLGFPLNNLRVNKREKYLKSSDACHFCV